MIFRVHFADGTKIDVQADTPLEASAAAHRQRNGVITKIKRLKEKR